MRVLIALFITISLISCASQGVRYTLDEIKNYPPEIQERITKGEITPGMTKEQVRFAWGNPTSVRILTPDKGKPREEWVYSSTLGIQKTRLIFIDGKLTYIIGTAHQVFEGE